MRIALIVFILLTKTLSLFSQDIVYRAEREKTFDLIHTKLKVDFNFSNQTMNGEAWITLTPHFYETNTVVLDAKAMIINSVTLINKPLSFEYKNKRKLEIKLPKVYKKGEELTLYIDYVAQPEKVYQKGSTAITSAKGLYFINADGKDKNKPTQIWTQGETEASSCWFPTIDAPNQKTSQEIYITVPKKYVTLSNGTLISQKTKDGNRTDYWKLDQKHAPYLFFMGIGEYEIIKDQYKDIPVHYYVEKEYAPYARDIFGNTPEMIGFFANKLGVEYPWNKYHQIVGRDYVSGAMENTTAGIEPLNRYETDFINTVDEGLYLCSLINHSHIGLLLDVYHMNIEEKNINESIKSAKNKLFHFHVAENDRGIPGSGTLDFDSIFETLKEINYSANVTLEMFIQANKQTSKDLFTWRHIEVDPYKAIKDSHLFLNKYF